MGQPVDFLELTINKVARKFGWIGFGLNLDAAKEIRALRRQECALLLNELAASTSDKLNVPLAAIDQLIRDVTVSRFETDRWLKSREGEAYWLWKSICVFEPKTDRAIANELVEHISIEQWAKLNDFLLQKLVDNAMPKATKTLREKSKSA